MNNKRIFLSICIPSYNRPDELKRLLESVDTKYFNEIEIVIREDMSPRRSDIAEVVQKYREKSKYQIRYYENEENYGYDKNIRESAKNAYGKWVMFMGDDDVLIPKKLDDFIDFLHRHSRLGYVLRRYQAESKNGVIEEYRYSNKNVFLKAGEKAVIEFFRRSVFISGFTYRKQCFSDYDCNDYDGTLLFQLYIQAMVCLKYPAAYCDIPITRSIEGGIPYFGKSKAEKGLYESGKNTVNNSINFLKQIQLLTGSFDEKNGTHIRKKVMKSYSKYSYGYLLEHRNEGIKVFRLYAREIRRIGLGNSVYFYIYYFALIVLGKQKCQDMIRRMKHILGYTPRL